MSKSRIHSAQSTVIELLRSGWFLARVARPDFDGRAHVETCCQGCSELQVANVAILAQHRNRLLIIRGSSSNNSQVRTVSINSSVARVFRSMKRRAGWHLLGSRWPCCSDSCPLPYKRRVKSLPPPFQTSPQCHTWLPLRHGRDARGLPSIHPSAHMMSPRSLFRLRTD